MQKFSEKIEECDRLSRIYMDTFDNLEPILMSDQVTINVGGKTFDISALGEYDMSALSLYIGKYVEQEINSSIVQLMRAFCGVEMPKNFCQRDVSNKADTKVVTQNGRTVYLNQSTSPDSRFKLKSIPLGDAYYALESLMAEDEEGFFDQYSWLKEPKFKDCWRMLFSYRNEVAHCGNVVNREDVAKNIQVFIDFLSYMPMLMELKRDLAPDGYFERQQPTIIKAEKTPEKPKPNIEVQNRYKELMAKMRTLNSTDSEFDNVAEELNTLINQYNWFSQVFEGENGLKGMKDAAGNLLVPALFEEISFTFNPHYLEYQVGAVKKNGKYGLVTLDGRATERTRFEYDEISPIAFTAGIFLYKKNGSKSFGFLNSKGEELTPTIVDHYYDIEPFGFIYKSGDYYGLISSSSIDDKLNQLPVYDAIEVEDIEGPVVFVKNGERGYLDLEGEFVPEHTLEGLDDDDRHDRLFDFLQYQ